ncbi:Xaa-Pro peptidase family protein [Nocardiopsis sp. NPDC049922]|uniref:Xaa-Pro peptidase family protein n=1 Tax=Nocardiopsis sp. NPDC049922 TaxID=3155157 RepID=UPI0033F79D2A
MPARTAPLAHTERLARRMDEQGVDVLVATTLENVHYLTGVASVTLEIFPHTGACFAVVTRDRLTRPHLITSRCDLDQALDAAVDLDGATGYGRFHRERADADGLDDRQRRLRELWGDGTAPATPADALVAVLRRAGLDTARVMVDEDAARADLLPTLRETLPGADVRPGGSALLRWVRKVKTEEELRRLRAVAAVAERGIRAVADIARPGVTERALVREFERTVAGEGGRPRFTHVKVGANAVMGQTRPTDTPLRSGDAVWFDVGCVHEGYWADIARVVSVGEPSAKLRHHYAAMLAGEERAIAEAAPGMTGKELFDITVEAVRAAGVGHYRRNHVGHGIGVEVYDRVLIAPDNDDVIEEGTVVNIETPYYEFGFGAVQVEDPFVVRAAGNELLTTLDRDLAVVG